MKTIKLRNEKLKADITGYLAALEALVRQRDALKMYDVNRHCEEFYCELLNEVLKSKHLGLKLAPADSTEHPNCKGLDLIDEKRRVMIQVTSSSTNEKVKHTFSMINDSQYDGFTLYFIFIAGKSEEIDLRKSRPPRFITCRRDNLLYPEDLTALLQGSTSKTTQTNYERVLEILQYYLGGENHNMRAEECFEFIAQIALLVKSVNHVKCMCDEILQGLEGKGRDDFLKGRVNHQVCKQIPDSLPDLRPIRLTWAKNIRIYGILLEISKLVFEIDCTGRMDFRSLDVREVKKLSEDLLSNIYRAIQAMCKETDISEEVAFTELTILANEM